MPNNKVRLDYFDPQLNREEFYEQFGIDYTEWHDYAEEMFQIENDLGYGKSMTNSYQILSSSLSPFNIYFINKSLKKIGDGTQTIKDIFRHANSYGLRSDEFTDQHDGLHILFAGCSITFGDGMPDDMVWARMTYDKIAETQKVSGFYNVATNGGNHMNIFNQIDCYAKSFGMPDVLFINFPDLRRLEDYGIPKEIMSLLAVYYSTLERLCELSNTKLISFTWDTEANLNVTGDIVKNKLFKNIPDPRELFGSTYHKFNADKRQEFMFEYTESNKSSPYKEFFIRGLDLVHPGLAEHAFYTELALEIYNNGTHRFY